VFHATSDFPSPVLLHQLQTRRSPQRFFSSCPRPCTSLGSPSGRAPRRAPANGCCRVPRALGVGRSASGARHRALGIGSSALGAQHRVLSIGSSASGAQHRELSIGSSALGARCSALGVGRSALGARHWELGVGRSASGAQHWELRIGHSVLGSWRWDLAPRPRARPCPAPALAGTPWPQPGAGAAPGDTHAGTDTVKTILGNTRRGLKTLNERYGQQPASKRHHQHPEQNRKLRRGRGAEPLRLGRPAGSRGSGPDFFSRKAFWKQLLFPFFFFPSLPFLFSPCNKTAAKQTRSPQAGGRAFGAQPATGREGQRPNGSAGTHHRAAPPRAQSQGKGAASRASLFASRPSLRIISSVFIARKKNLKEPTCPLSQKITESQNGRGWKGPLWVI